MGLDSDEALQRHLLPGETVIQRYREVVSQGRFRAVLTDRRVLLIGRNAAEEVHLNAISSMGWEARRRRGLIAAGAGLAFFSLLGYNMNSYYGRSDFLLLFIVGVALAVAGGLLQKHTVRVYTAGRQFEFRGGSANLHEFMRDVRLQQAQYSGYAQGGPPVQTPQVAPPTQYSEKETITEIVKVPCRYCGTLVPVTSAACPSCAAPLHG